MRRRLPAAEAGRRVDLTEAETASEPRPRTLPMLRVVGQVGACYVVAEGPAGLYLIDQHAAHERILYEQLMAQRATQGAVAQQALDGVTVGLGRSGAALVQEKVEALTAIGFLLEPFGGSTYLIRAVPDILADRDPAEALRVIIGDLETNVPPGQATLEERIAARACKTAAIKAGQTLSFSEMQELIRQLERCANPHTCPHGRPTMIHISADQLAKEFGRE
jgi:DNA mismatch repair protein MutL